MPPKPLAKGQASLSSYFGGGSSASPTNKSSGNSAPKATPSKSQGSSANGSAKPKSSAAASIPMIVSDSDEEEAKPAAKAKSSSSAKPTQSKPSRADVVAISDSEDEAPKGAPKEAPKMSWKDWKDTSKSTSSPQEPKSVAPRRRGRDYDFDYEYNEDWDISDLMEYGSLPPKRRAVGSSSKPIPKKTAPSSKSAPSRKAQAKDMDVSDSEGQAAKPKAKSTAKKSGTGNGKAKSAPEPVDDGTAVEGIDIDEAINRFGDPNQEGGDGKNAWFANKAKREGGPVAPGSKDIPEGKPNCLAAYTFVFTGELSSLSREDALNLAKRYGGRVTGAPSSKTTHVVMGDGAGKSKLDKIKKSGLKCKIIDEDGFLQLIGESKGGNLSEQQIKKLQEEEKRIKETAKELALTSPAASSSKTKGKTEDAPGLNLGSAVSGAGKAGVDLDPAASLWTTKYAPRKMKDLVGNKGAIEKIQKWLEKWPQAMKSNFKKPGPDGSGIFRALLLYGPPGIGKTSAAHLVSRSLGFTPIELNASDARSKKLVELALKDAINNTNLDGWFNAGKGVDKALNPAGIQITDKTVLIMDEVDGMSGGDRGGVGAINTFIRKTKVPIICICNDRRNPKMKPFETTCFSIQFRKPDSQAIKSRLLSIAFVEKLKIPQEVMLSLIESAQGDIRQVINMLSTWALINKTMTFDEGKAFGAANARQGIQTPFTLYSELVGPYMFSHTSKKTINDKADYYFQDPTFLPLLMHENFLKQRPATLTRTGNQSPLALLELFSKAAESISDGDMIDSMIHGPQQHWSLMPQHAIASCVRPASLVYGTSSSFPNFPAWLGKNSSQNKLRRANTDIQTRMRLVASGSAQEIRQTYEPVLFGLLTEPLIKNGKDGVSEVIELMDEYFLGIEDRDAILELGVGNNDGEKVTQKIPSAIKAAFTRTYNSRTHPIAFYKITDLAAAKAKPLKGDAVPDLEEAYEQDEEPAEDDADGDEDEGDVGKDKLVKAKKPKAAAAKGKGKAKAKS